MKLSIIIVSFNSQQRLRQNLVALRAAAQGFPSEIFVVDNASSDGTQAMVAAEFPGVTLIASDRNLGFARANNLALVRAEGEFLLLLNPDMLVGEDTLSTMVNWLAANPRVAVAGCRLVDEAGNTLTNARRFPTLWNQLAIVLKLPHLFSGLLNSYLCHDLDPARATRADSLRGSFLLIRRAAVSGLAGEGGKLTLPLLDERYFLWFEEVDYCRQLAACDREVWYCPEASCVDYVGQSFAQLPRRRKQAYFRASMLDYFAKWHPRWQYLVLRLAWAGMRWPVALLDALQVNSRAKT